MIQADSQPRTIELTPDTRTTVLAAAHEVLRDGGVIQAPTETVHGLMTRWENLPGRRRIFEMKDRPADKRLQMLAADLPTALAAGVIPDPRLERLADTLWPGPLTVVARARPPWDTIGLRIPAHAFLLELLNALAAPLAATSANRTGQPTPTDPAAAAAQLTAPPDLLILAPAGNSAASTVLSIIDDTPTILRPGPICLEHVRQALAHIPSPDGGR